MGGESFGRIDYRAIVIAGRPRRHQDKRWAENCLAGPAPPLRHGRACPGHPRFIRRSEDDRDARP
jgi:hypothetical protein